MNKQLIALGIIGILVTIGISGCLEEKTSYVTFTVYKEFQVESYNITVYNVSIPLSESEAIIVFEKIMGSKPKCWIGENEVECPIEKIEYGWSIPDGIIGLNQGYLIINEQNRTAHWYPGI